MKYSKTKTAVFYQIGHVFSKQGDTEYDRIRLLRHGARAEYMTNWDSIQSPNTRYGFTCCWYSYYAEDIDSQVELMNAYDVSQSYPQKAIFLGYLEDK